MSKKRNNAIMILIKLVSDMAVVLISFYLAYWLRFVSGIIPADKGMPPAHVYIRAIPVVILVFLAVFKWRKFYEEQLISYKMDEFLNILNAVTVAIIVTTAGTFLYREYNYSRLFMGYAYILNIALLFAMHRLRRLLRLKILLPISGTIGILVLGGAKVKRALEKKIKKHKEFKIIFSEDKDLKNIVKIILRNGINEVVVADSSWEHTELLKLINFCEKREIEFKLVPDMLELKMGEMSFDRYFDVPVLTLKHPLFEPTNYYVKRIFDIIIAMLALVVLGPFLLFLMLLILLDSPGSVIYSQLRKGYKGRVFKFYKFRSMILDADNKLKALMKQNERPGPVFKMRKDPRVTKVGKFIRKYSIDEIPQLFNVLKGDMSLVGPRPQVLWEAQVYDLEAKRRLNILPGVTGLWQVSGRSDLSYEEMIKLDLYYLENWSPGLDVKILFKTIPVVVLKKGAY